LVFPIFGVVAGYAGTLFASATKTHWTNVALTANACENIDLPIGTPQMEGEQFFTS
jgi:hypothetical protein